MSETRAKHAGNKGVQSCRVTRDGTFEFETFPLGQDRDPVVTDGSTQKHAISRTSLIGGKPNPG
jgi:hypothetical protein